MHHQGYAHLDIKLENILLDEFYNIKLADFGSSLDLSQTNGYTHLRRGTKFYLPPEIENEDEEDESYNGYSSDVYTLGITLFLLLTGEFPSRHCLEETESNTTSDESEPDNRFHELDVIIKSKWKCLSNEVKTLLMSMINPDPSLRPSVTELLESEWFTNPFPYTIYSEVFNEMTERKNYMVSSLKKNFD